MNDHPLVDHQAERCVLGSMALAPTEAIDIAADILQAQHFHKPAHQIVFKTLLRMQADGRDIDTALLADDLERDGKLSSVGGITGLMEILESVPNAHHCGSYAASVLDFAKRRQAAEVGRKLTEQAADLTTDISESLASVESSLHTAIESGIRTGPKTLQQGLGDVFREIDFPDTTPRILTGWQELDGLTNGIRLGSVVVVGARPSVGKSALACNLALKAAKAGTGVLICSYEMSLKEVAARLLSLESDIPGNLFHSRREEINRHAVELQQLPIGIADDSPNINSLCAMIRVSARRGTRLVVCDYLQLVEPDDKRAPREQQIAGMSRRLKLEAMRSRVAILLLSQLNRQSEIREDKWPRLADLRESGSIEQDCDQCWFLHRPHKDAAPDQTGTHPDDTATIIVAKNRQGPTGSVSLEWHPAVMAFRERGYSNGGYFR